MPGHPRPAGTHPLIESLDTILLAAHQLVHGGFPWFW